ncbi:hypothetical protein COLO4_09203 [Corchorus olitorius]|uniref:Uncharacterized protein n=1 Tax=Corchorus olitorius TaxID=93759 RepID=A0A1R3KCZ0_9ROSI|nr:hypothetical protein COLO4_09203 [Corchorus olitorius]
MAKIKANREDTVEQAWEKPKDSKWGASRFLTSTTFNVGA